MKIQSTVCIIGGGAAGMTAAIAASRTAHELGVEMNVLLLERNRSLGRKLAITGKGRGNITNTLPVEEFIEAFGPDGRFLRPAFASFFGEELVELLGEAGLEVKAERGGRVFPVTDRATDIVQALGLLVMKADVDIQYDHRITKIARSGAQFRISVQGRGSYAADAVVVATGGKSYPGTGSSGDGYSLLKELGHTIVQPLPGLVPLRCTDVGATAVAGVSLEGIELTAWSGKRELDRRSGELVFTEHGIGGPAALSLSLAVAKALGSGEHVSVTLDTRPLQSCDKVAEDVRAARTSGGVRTYFQRFLPRSFADVLLQLSGLAGEEPHRMLSSRDVETIVGHVKRLEFACTGTEPLSTAIITQGGIPLKEVDPRTMGSRIVPGLFVAGELLDLQAVTGGFNLQEAFSTGYLGGKCAVQFVAKSANTDTIRRLER